jgi:hypothetical protein
MVAFTPGVNNSLNKEKRLFQVKVIRLRSRKSFASFGPKMKDFARKEIS